MHYCYFPFHSIFHTLCTRISISDLSYHTCGPLNRVVRPDPLSFIVSSLLFYGPFGVLCCSQCGHPHHDAHCGTHCHRSCPWPFVFGQGLAGTCVAGIKHHRYIHNIIWRQPSLNNTYEALNNELIFANRRRAKPRKEPWKAQKK